MRKVREATISAAALDIKEISEQLVNLPHDELMYVAGAITALAATNKPSADARPSA